MSGSDLTPNPRRQKTNSFGEFRNFGLSAHEARQLNHPAEFMQGDPAQQAEVRQAYPWCAEFDLLQQLKLPAVPLGAQTHPLMVRASYLAGPLRDEAPAERRVESLRLVTEFALGVLFVHGIGEQTKSETLSNWTAPLLRWINGWFQASSGRLAERADPENAEGWLAALVVRDDWLSRDTDAGERSRLAGDFTSQVMAKTFATHRELLVAGVARSADIHTLRQVRPEEHLACQAFERHLHEDLGVTMVSGSAVLADARLIDGDAPITRPSTVEMCISTLAIDGHVERARWLLAESWWADSFRAPSFALFVTWCLGSAPAIWVHYFAMLFERGGRSRWRGLRLLVPLTTAVLMAVIGMLLVWVLAIVPNDRVRSALLSVQRLLAGVVGDSYVFLNDVVQSRAIIDRVRRDVEWLSQRCRGVVVVAHSQGAAIADKAVNKPSEYQPQALKALVTLGSGKQTLDRIADLRDSLQVRFAGWLALASAGIAWLGVVLVLATSSAGLGGALALAGGLGMVWAAVVGWNAHPRWSRSWIAAASVKPWDDFYATRDPVPMGPLRDPTDPVPLYHPHEVGNRSSYLTDHTSYWQNPEEFVGPLARILARENGADFFHSSVPDRAAIQSLLARSREARLLWLRVARVMVILTTLWMAWVQRAELDEVAQWAVAAFGVKLGIAAAHRDFPGWGAIWHVASIVLPVLLYAGVIVATWASWGEAEVKACLRAQVPRVAVVWLWLSAALLTALPAMVCALETSTNWADIGVAWPIGTLLAGGAIHLLHRGKLG